MVSIFELTALEWRRLRRDWVFWAAVGLCIIAFWYGLGNGYAWMHFQQRAIQRAEIIAREKLAEAKAKAAELNRDPGRPSDVWSDPRSAIGFEGTFLHLYDCLKPAPLAMVGVGQSDLLPYCVRVTTGPWPNFLASYEWENPLRLLLGRFDCTFVSIYLLPLLVAVISFNLLSRERELGTLPLLFSYPVSPQRWLAVGFLVRAGLFLGLTLSALALGLFLGGFDPTAEGALWRLVLWLALIAGYGGFWFGLAWLVNARGGSSASNAVTLAIVWLVLVIVLPTCLNLLVKEVYPLPSRVEFINAIRDATARAERQGSTLLKKYLQDHPDLAPGDRKANENDFFRTLIAVNGETERVLAPTQQRFRIQSQAQTALIERLAFLSPAIVFQQAGNALSGNDQARHRHFMDAVDAHRALVKQFFDPKFVSEAPFTAYEEVPRFDYRTLDVRPVTRITILGILILTAPTLLFGVWGWGLLRRPIFEARGWL